MTSFVAQAAPLLLVVGICCGTVHAQQCQQCPKSSGPYLPVNITTDDSYRYVHTYQCPPYENPKWLNPGVACQHDTTYVLPLKPTYPKTSIPVGEADVVYDGILYLKTSPAPIFGALGVLQNGVNVFGVGSPCGYSSRCPDEGAPTPYVDAVASEGWTVDECGGHADPHGTYHIHSGVAINTSAALAACKLPVNVKGEHSKLLGWIFDGFGLYGPYSLGGVPPTDLDACGGHTHKIDGVETYHYHLPYPAAFPWTVGCLTGCPEVSNNPRELSFVTGSAYGCPGSSVTPSVDKI